jgi:hypothetical protein
MNLRPSIKRRHTASPALTGNEAPGSAASAVRKHPLAAEQPGAVGRPVSWPPLQYSAVDPEAPNFGTLPCPRRDGGALRRPDSLGPRRTPRLSLLKAIQTIPLSHPMGEGQGEGLPPAKNPLGLRLFEITFQPLAFSSLAFCAPSPTLALSLQPWVLPLALAFVPPPSSVCSC